MASKIDLVSNALILIGDNPINSLTGNAKAQVVASNLYDSIVQAELSKHDWGFARKKVQVSKTTDTLPDSEYDSVHQLPSDLLVLREVRPRQGYRVYGKKIYSNNGTQKMTIDYTANVAESFWPPYFEEMIQYALARNFATPIRDSAAARAEMTNEYLNASRMARYQDSQQYPTEQLASSPFIEARW